jgi:hypothetical protein
MTLWPLVLQHMHSHEKLIVGVLDRVVLYWWWLVFALAGCVYVCIS